MDQKQKMYMETRNQLPKGTFRGGEQTGPEMLPKGTFR